MSSVPFSFGPKFQESMLSLMLKDVSFTDKCCNYIDEEYLFNDAFKWMFRLIKNKFKTTGSVPTYVEIEDALKTEERHKRRMFKSFADKIFASEPKSVDYLRDNLEDFAKRTAFADLFQHGQTLYNSGETLDAYSYVLEAINHLHGISFKDEQTIPISDFEDFRRLYASQKGLTTDRIPTGIEPIDDILLGGLSKLEGELGVILAEPKKGKSLSLVHMGFMALGSPNCRVAHVVLEGSTERTIFRYQSRWSGIPEKNIARDDLTDHEQQRLTIMSKRYKDRLTLIPFNNHWDYTTGDLEGKINELIREGKKPDLLVIDYADLLKPRESMRDPRHDQREVFRDLKRIAYMHKIAIFTASQAQRPSHNPEKRTLLRSRNVAESFEKIRIADFICTLNQTPEEKQAGLLRFHADLYRANECDKTIWLITDFTRMIFYTRRYGCRTQNQLPRWMLKTKPVK